MDQFGIDFTLREIEYPGKLSEPFRQISLYDTTGVMSDDAIVVRHGRAYRVSVSICRLPSIVNLDGKR